MLVYNVFYLIRAVGAWLAIIVLGVTLSRHSPSWRVRRGATVAACIGVIGLGLLLTDLLVEAPPLICPNGVINNVCDRGTPRSASVP